MTHNDGRIDGIIAMEQNLTIDSGAEDGNGWIVFKGNAANQTWSYSTLIVPTTGIKVDKTAGTVSQAGGTTDLYCSRFALSSGTFIAPSNLFKLSNHWGYTSTTIFDHTAGTFTHNNGTTRFQPAGTSYQTFTINTLPGDRFYDVIVDVNGSANARINVTAGDTVYALNNITHNDGRIDGVIAMEQNLTIDSGAEDGNGWIVFKGNAANQTWSYSTSIVPTTGIKVDKAAGTVSQAGGTTDLYCSRFALSSGTFIAPSNLMRLSNHWGYTNTTIFDHTAGTFTHNNGTTRFQPTATSSQNFTVNTASGSRFYDVIIDVNGSANARITVTAGDTVYALNNITHNDGRIDGILALENDLTIDAFAEDGNGWIIFKGNTPNQTWNYSTFIVPTTGIMIDKTAGTVSEAIGTTDLYCSRFALSGGTFIAPSNLLKLSNHWGYTNTTIFDHTAGTFTHNNGTTRFEPRGTSAQSFAVNTLPGSRFYNVITDINGTSNARISISGSDTIYVLNNLTLDDGRINGGYLFVEGNVDINPNSTGGSTPLYFVQGNAQTFDLSGAESAFNGNVYFDKTANNVTLLSACKFDNSSQNVYFNTGDLVGSSANLVTFGNNTLVHNASKNSFIDGPVLKRGNDIFEFPVGKNDTAYAPITISAPSNITHQFRAEYFQIDPNTIPYDATLKDASIEHISACEYWTLDRISGASNVNVTLSWDDRSCGVTDLAELTVARWDGSMWKDHGNGGTTGNIANGTIISSGTVNSFSPFTLASTSLNNPLPISLLSFNVKKQLKEALLEWETASEINNKEFEVQHAVNGLDFTTFKIIEGAGNSSQLLKYSSLHRAPINGINYYRLKQIDFNGEYTYSTIKTIDFNLEDEFTMYPNPTNQTTTIYYNPKLDINHIDVFDNLGRNIMAISPINSPENGQLLLDFKAFNSGMYYVRIYLKDKVITKKIVKN